MICASRKPYTEVVHYGGSQILWKYSLQFHLLFFYSIKIFHWLFLFELLLDSPTELIQLTDSLSEYFLYICFFAWLCVSGCDAVLNILHS